MQKQTSALQKLADLFEKASNKGEKSEPSLTVLLEIMKSSYCTDDPVEFFGLLYKAKEEVDKINKLRPEVSRHPIKKLHDFIVENNIYKMQWTQLKSYIEDKGIVDLLISLAENYETRNPTIFLESEFLDGLKDEFNSLLDEILRSDLSRDLKTLLHDQIQDILYAIRRYSIDGSDGLQKATQSFVSNLVTIESRLDKKDKKNSIYRKSVSGIIALLRFLQPNSIYDILGVVPAMDDYYRPRIEEFIKNRQEIEESIDETSTTTKIIEKSLQLSNKQPQKSLPGKVQQSLPSAKEKPPLKMEANLED